MIGYNDLREALDLLRTAKITFNHEDYVVIWGKQLGSHIWFQHGSDLLSIWRSGLTHSQSDSFVEYILDKFQNKK